MLGKPFYLFQMGAQRTRGRARRLFSEQRLKRSTRIAGARALAFLRRLPLERDARRIETALIALVLARNASRNGLGAFEAGRRVKVRALFTAMKLKATVRTTAIKVRCSGENLAAVSAARDLVRAGQPWRFRPKDFRLTLGAVSGTLIAGIHVASLAVFLRHRRCLGSENGRINRGKR